VPQLNNRHHGDANNVTAADCVIRATDAANFTLDEINFPHGLRGLVDALIGASGGRATFECSHLALAARLGLQGNEFARTKAVQRLLNKLEAWQRANGILLFTITRGGGIEQNTTKYADHITPVALAAMDEFFDHPQREVNPRGILEPIARRHAADLPKTTAQPESKPLPKDNGELIALSLGRMDDMFRNLIAPRVLAEGGNLHETVELIHDRLENIARNQCAKMSCLSTTSAPSACDGNAANMSAQAEVVTNSNIGEPGQMCPRSPLDFALEHARAGIPVFPVSRKTKKPITPNGFYAATTDVQQIEAWGRRHPSANYAMPTGEASGITVLDDDPRHGGDESLKRLIDEYGGFEATKVIKTGGGGLHFYFRRVPGLRNSESLLAPGLDIRADGGYVVIAGGLHASGVMYDVLCDEPLAEMPAWIIEKLSAVKRERDKPVPEDTAEPHAPRSDVSRVRIDVANGSPIPDGVQNCTLFRKVACSLRGRGAEYDEILAAVRAANDERCMGKKLDDAELRKLSKSATRYAPGRAAGMASHVIVRRDASAGKLPETERNFNETLTEFDVSPDIENLRKPKIVPDEPAPKAEPHGFGRIYHVWSFPTASGAPSYAPKDVKQ
jgi:hypothetical protein